jgi:hypothetical protein
MEEITGDMKVAEVLRRWPKTAQVFRNARMQATILLRAS